MKLRKLIFFVKSDLYRYCGRMDISSFIKSMLIHPGFKYIFYMRLCKYLRSKAFTRYSLFIPARLILQHYSYKYGIDISYSTDIGSGFYIGHFGCIVVNGEAKIGDNCNISQGVTLGQANRGKNKGCPVIGSNVYIGPGAKIVGKVIIGDNAAIGANCVCTRDIPDNAVVVGIPGEVISYKGSHSYVNRVDYDKQISI